MRDIYYLQLVSMFCAAVLVQPAFAQSGDVNNHVLYQGQVMRVPILADNKTVDVELCGLTVGQTYHLAASGLDMPEGDVTVGLKGSAYFLPVLDVVADAECILLSLQVAETGKTVHLSVSHDAAETFMPPDAVITVQPGVSADSLVKNVLVGGNCFSV